MKTHGRSSPRPLLSFASTGRGGTYADSSAALRAEASGRDPDVRQRAGRVIRAIAAEWQGTWECVAHHADGRLVTRNPPYTSRRTFRGPVVAGQAQGDAAVPQRGRPELAEAGDHVYEVTDVPTEGNGRGETALGIAAFRDGQLRFSFRPAGPGAGRPAGFVSEGGDQVVASVCQQAE
jgi:hypothetical protein